MGPPFGLFCSAKYLNFEGENCGIIILSRSIQEIYTFTYDLFSSPFSFNTILHGV